MCAKVIDTLKEPHWLPLQAAVDYMILSLMHQCTHGTAPTFRKETLKAQNEDKVALHIK